MGGAGVGAHRSCPCAALTAEPSQGLDGPGTGLPLVSPLGMQRKMISEGYRTAWSIWPVLGDQELLGPTLRAEIDLFMCIKQTGVNYTIYTSSIFFLSLSGLAVIIPDLVAAHRSPCGDKLHGGIRLILTFSKSMKSGAWPAGPGYQVMAVSVNSASQPQGCFLSSSAKTSSFVLPREVLDWVCFLLEGERTLRFAPSASLCLLCKCKWEGMGHPILCFVAFPTSQTRQAGTWEFGGVGYGGYPWLGRKQSGISWCGLPSGAQA